jgi:hypothetical protein
MHLIDLLGCEGQLGYHVFFGREAVEGVVLGGDVHAVKGLYVGEVVLYVETVALEGLALDPVFLAAVEAG